MYMTTPQVPVSLLHQTAEAMEVKFDGLQTCLFLKSLLTERYRPPFQSSKGEIKNTS